MMIELTTTRQAKARSEIYQSFSALFCEPEEEILSEENIFQQLRNAFEVIQPSQLDLVNELAGLSSKYTNRELLVAYTKIFLGPFEVIAYPYSSMYYGEKGLMTEVTSWVENFYRHVGVEFDFGVRDLPDHIVVELEFMYLLAFKEWESRLEERMEDAEQYAEVQKEFLLKHLSTWGTKMSDTIIGSETNEFYKVLAKLLKAFLLQEKIDYANIQN